MKSYNSKHTGDGLGLPLGIRQLHAIGARKGT